MKITTWLTSVTALIVVLGCGRENTIAKEESKLDTSSQGANRLARQAYTSMSQRNLIPYDPKIIGPITEGDPNDRLAERPLPIAVPQPTPEFSPSFLSQGNFQLSLADIDGDGYLDLVVGNPGGLYVAFCTPRVGCGRMTSLLDVVAPLQYQNPQFVGRPGSYSVKLRSHGDSVPLNGRLRTRLR